jgi:hypothetical protein
MQCVFALKLRLAVEVSRVRKKTNGGKNESLVKSAAEKTLVKRAMEKPWLNSNGETLVKRAM